MDEFMDE